MPAWNRTWYTQMNCSDPDNSSATNASKGMFWAIKAILKGELTGTNGPEGAPPGSAYWTCEGSSDGATAGMDGTDRLTSTYTIAKIVQAAGAVAHTWIVLKSPTSMPGGPYYLLMDYNGSATQVIKLYASRAAFTGGSITARPTSTKEWDASGITNEFQITDNTASNFKISMAISANGDFYLAFLKATSGYFWGAWAFTSLDQTRTGDTTKAITMIAPFAVAGAFSATLLTTTRCKGRTFNDAASSADGAIQLLDYYHSTTAAWNTVSGGVNATDSKADVLPLFVYDKTAGALGVRGLLPDAWLAGSQLANGTVEPSTGNIKHVSIGQVMLPFSVTPTL